MIPPPWMIEELERHRREREERERPQLQIEVPEPISRQYERTPCDRPSTTIVIEL